MLGHGASGIVSKGVWTNPVYVSLTYLVVRAIRLFDPIGWTMWCRTRETRDVALKQLVLSQRELTEVEVNDFLREIKLMRCDWERERESIIDSIKSCVSEWYLTQAIIQWSINTCSVLKHKFVVEFLGISFRTQNEMVLVIEFMQHGNLRDLLDRKGNNLPWKLRLRLLKDAAKGMYVSRSRSLSLNMIRIEGNTD